VRSAFLNRLGSGGLGQFAGHMSIYGLAEIAGKLSRLVTTVALARALAPEMLGLAVLALSIGELLKAFTESGVGQRIVAATDEELQAVVNTAYRLFWAIALLLFLAQIGVAALAASLEAQPDLFTLVALLGLQYLIMPPGQVACFLAMRDRRLRRTAFAAAVQLVFSNLVAAALVFLWADPLAVILPKVASALVWYLTMRRAAVWRYRPDAGFAPLKSFRDWTLAVLGGELLKSLRLQADKLIVAAALGLELLGLYYFAFNAGLGIALSLGNAAGLVLLPHLAARAGQERRRFFLRSLALLLAAMLAVASLQALLAPWYLPLIFGPQWPGMPALVSLLCFAAVPIALGTAVTQWMRANGRPLADLAAAGLNTAALLLAVLLLAPLGLLAIAWGTLAVTSLFNLAYALYALRPFRRGDAAPARALAS